MDKSERRENFVYFLMMQLRWDDHDGYGHVNNARYHAFFDSTTMSYLTGECGFDMAGGPVVVFTVENMCRYHRAVAFPDVIECGLRVAKLGNSSVRYEFGVFAAGVEDAAATGYFIDVFVERASEEPISIPEEFRAALSRLMVGA